MALTAIVTEWDNLVGTIEFDAVVREQHTLSAQATEHAIEGFGQSRTDHVLQRPDALVLECTASNTPIRAPRTQANGTREVRAEGSEIGLSRGNFPSRVNTIAFDPPFDRRQDVWAELRRMKEAGELVTVVTSLQEYTSMVIEEVTTECTAANGRSLDAVITLKRIPVSQTQTVDAPEIPKPAQSRGKQNATPDTEQGSARTSALFKAADGAGLLP